MKILVDENLPRSLVQDLIDAGYEALDVRACGIRGSPDEIIFNFAQERGASILTRDKGFGNIWRFPLGQHFGIIIVRLPNEMVISQVKAVVIAKLLTLSPLNVQGNVVIIELEKIRIRKH